MSNHQLQNKINNGLTKGMINAFVCPDLHTVITKNVDNGHIPVIIGCPVCGGEADSRHYNVNQNLGHTIEWYKLTEGEMTAKMLSMDAKKAAGFKEYIVKGGLISRLREEPEIKKFTESK